MLYRTLGIFTLLGLMILFLPKAEAQTPPKDPSEIALQALAQMDSAKAGDTVRMGPTDIIVPAGVLRKDSMVLATYKDAWQAYYQYRVDGFAHRNEVFEWQLFSQKWIFVIVLLLVITGVAFSGIQFRKGLKENKTEVSEFEASTSGVKVSSPVLGVVILALSLAFFYLYLVYIYPINEIL